MSEGRRLVAAGWLVSGRAMWFKDQAGGWMDIWGLTLSSMVR
jgi:hypothetical protein